MYYNREMYYSRPSPEMYYYSGGPSPTTPRPTLLGLEVKFFAIANAYFQLGWACVMSIALIIWGLVFACRRTDLGTADDIFFAVIGFAMAQVLLFYIGTILVYKGVKTFQSHLILPLIFIDLIAAFTAAGVAIWCIIILASKNRFLPMEVSIVFLVYCAVHFVLWITLGILLFLAFQKLKKIRQTASPKPFADVRSGHTIVFETRDYRSGLYRTIPD